MWARNRCRERWVADQGANDHPEVTDEQAAEPPRKVDVSVKGIARIEVLLRPFSHCATLLLLP
jgi:hypothetical protein